MARLEDYLKRNSELYPDKVAVICGSETVTYSQLYEMAVRRADELRQIVGNIAYRTIEAAQTIGYLVEYFAIHIAGFVAVPLEKDLPQERLDEIEKALSESELPAQAYDILFTTGTTGKSKGVIISSEAIIADAENLIDAQGFSGELMFVITGPLNHAGCWSKVFPVIMLGATIYLIDGMKNLECFYEALAYPCEKVATFLVPASLRMLMRFSAERLREFADKIDFIETGAAPMAQSDMQELCGLLPMTRLYNTYASTETGIVCTYNFNDGKCIVGCVGRQMKHSRVFIADDGSVACKGPTLMTGYVGGMSSEEVLRDETVYTSDLGEIDDEGMLHLKGRQDDVINVGGYKLAPTEVEDLALSFPEVCDCICVTANHPVIGIVPKLLVVMQDGMRLDKRELALFLKQKLESYKVPQYYEQVDAIARTFNGKLNRKYYREIEK